MASEPLPQKLQNSPQPTSIGGVHTTSSVGCPDDQTLLHYADLSLNTGDRTTVERHLAQCPECAVFVADLQRISAPVVRLHNKSLIALVWFSLFRKGRLSSRLKEAWSLHRESCPPCQQKVMTLERLGLRTLSPAPNTDNSPMRVLPQILAPTLSFSLGVLLMFHFYHPTIPSPNSTYTSPPGSAVKGPTLPIGIDLSTEGLLQSMLTPPTQNPSRQESQIDAWKALPQEMDSEKQACLGGLYLRIGQKEPIPKERQLWLNLSKESLLKAKAEIDHQLQTVDRLSETK